MTKTLNLYIFAIVIALQILAFLVLYDKSWVA